MTLQLNVNGDGDMRRLEQPRQQATDAGCGRTQHRILYRRLSSICCAWRFPCRRQNAPTATLQRSTKEAPRIGAMRALSTYRSSGSPLKATAWCLWLLEFLQKKVRKRKPREAGIDFAQRGDDILFPIDLSGVREVVLIDQDWSSKACAHAASAFKRR